MGMEGFRKKAKDVIKAAIVGGSLISGAAAEAQTYKQQSYGDNSPNIIGSGNAVNRGGNTEFRTPGGNIVRMDGTGKPNISSDRGGSIRQESRGNNSPNIIDKKFFKDED